MKITRDEKNTIEFALNELYLHYNNKCNKQYFSNLHDLKYILEKNFNVSLCIWQLDVEEYNLDNPMNLIDTTNENNKN